MRPGRASDDGTAHHCAVDPDHDAVDNHDDLAGRWERSAAHRGADARFAAIACARTRRAATGCGVDHAAVGDP